MNAKQFFRNFIIKYHCVLVSDSTPELKSDAVNGLLAGTKRRKILFWDQYNESIASNPSSTGHSHEWYF